MPVQKRKHVFALALLAASCAYFPAWAATLADSVAVAVETHPSIAAGKAQAAAAHKTVWEQRSNLFPALSVNASAGRERANNDTTRGVTGGNATSWVGQGGVTLTQPVFAGLGLVNRVKAAAAREESAVFTLSAEAENVALRAARAHLNLMRTKELLALARTYDDAIRARNDSIDLMVKEGVADEAEALQAKEALSIAHTTRLGYEEAWQQAEADYIEVAGGKPDGDLSFGEAVWESAVPADADAAVRIALADNQNLRAAENALAAAGREADALKGDLMPKLNAALSYDKKDQDDALSGESTDAAAMLRMSWNFSTGGGDFARISRGKDVRAEAQAGRDRAAREVERDVRQKFTSMKIVDEQSGLLHAREGDVRSILDSFLKQFEAGKQSNLQLISAHGKLFDVQAQRTDADYRRLLSRFELLAAMGKLRETVAGPVVADAAGPKKD